MRVKTRVQVSALEGCHKGTNAGLRGHAGQTVGGSIDGIRTRLRTSDHGRDSGTSRIVSVYMDGEIRVLLPDGSDEDGSSSWFEHSRHCDIITSVLDSFVHHVWEHPTVFHTEHVSAHCHDLIYHVHVVLEVVLLVRVLLGGC